MMENIKTLSETNYVRKGSRENNYWFDLNKNKLQSYVEKYGENFNVIIHNIDESNPGDFYSIPFSILKAILVNDFLIQPTGKNKAVRWIGSIKNHSLLIRNSAIQVDISGYYGNPRLLESQNKLAVPEAEENDYSIENRLIEIRARVKQSVFRKAVLKNFQQSCCLTGVKETELIIASHIIPWSHKIETRLNPANGLPLFSSYDRLFDVGYISFTDDLKVIITPRFSQTSSELQKILKVIKNKQAIKPIQYQINPEFLEYHRDIILKK